MATQARSYEAFQAAETAGVRREGADPYRLRPIPNESVYFYRKTIDNSRVVRQADPRGGARCWRWVATTSAITLLLVALLLPDMYGLVAGYRIESLREEQNRLLALKAEVEVQEARVLSPDNLVELADLQEFVDPSPGQVVRLTPAGDGSLAWNARKK